MTGKPKGLDQPVPTDAAEPASLDTNSRGLGLTDQKSAEVGPDVQGHLGRKLKASYDELVRQPVPDRFRQLLEELERREKKN
jgi:hypothetical protein